MTQQAVLRVVNCLAEASVPLMPVGFFSFRQANNNQNKPGFPKKNQYTNTKLEVRKIPPELNNITQLNEHFSKFGTIVNIQVNQ